jgi:hypothetical protein
MTRRWAYMLLAGVVAMMVTPRAGTAQVAVRVQLYWEWADGAWRPHRTVWDEGRSAYWLTRVAMVIPRGHLPPPGYCREWIPGVPPGRQPRAVRCEELFRPHRVVRKGVVILGAPGFAGPVERIDARAREDRDHGRRERGRGRHGGS